MIFNLFRTYEELHTDGELYVNGEKIGETLEDVGRPHGVKIPLETCIPEGVYQADITYSPSFKRNMVVLFNVKSDHSVDRLGSRFTGIRVHGGNSTDHTAGCVIVAKNSDKNGWIGGSIESDVLALVKSAKGANEQCLWVIS